MKVKSYPGCEDHPIAVNASGCDHMMSIEEAEQLAHDLNKAIIAAKGVGPNDAYFEHMVKSFLDDDMMKLMETEEGLIKVAVWLIKLFEREARHRACDILQAAIKDVHNMEYK